MPFTIRLTALALSLGLVSAAPAGAADILASCAPDIEEYCSQVEPGHGRLISCLYAHELVISDACDGAMGDAADILDTMFFSMRVVLTECSADILTKCDGIAPGEGRIFSCLANHEAELSDGCSDVISTVRLPGDR